MQVNTMGFDAVITGAKGLCPSVWQYRGRCPLFPSSWERRRLDRCWLLHLLTALMAHSVTARYVRFQIKAGLHRSHGIS